MKAMKTAMVLSVVLGIIGASMLKLNINNKEKTLDKRLRPVKIVVAGKDLNKETILTRQELSLISLPKKLITDDMIKASSYKSIMGFITDKPFRAGEIIFKSTLLDPKDGSLLNEDADKRLVPLNFDSFENQVFNLRNRDRIDIFLTYTANGGAFTKILLQNIEVKKPLKEDSKKPSKGSAQGEYYLLLTAEESQIWAHAQDKGRLSYAIRNLKDNSVNPERILDDKKLSLIMDGSPSRTKKSSIEIISSDF
jgi:Flp pilus assembly protein CpaB